MILVADSGSTKTDWLLSLGNGELKQFRTSGLNPYFLSEKEIFKILQDQATDIFSYGQQINEIYFYGAGCSSPDRHEIISNALTPLFQRSYISVDSDLLGSAYATCGHEKGLCCVLGTGSNISFFDGENIHEGKHGLGFVLGDEGAGTWFGKALITEYLYGRMPAAISQKFANSYQLDKGTVIKHVYGTFKPNSYLATFCKFLSEIRDTGYGQTLIRRGLQEFVDTNIKSYPEHLDCKCHFVGSIAYIFADELKEVCSANNIRDGKIIQQPIHDLMAFILQREQAA